MMANTLTAYTQTHVQRTHTLTHSLTDKKADDPLGTF